MKKEVLLNMRVIPTVSFHVDYYAFLIKFLYTDLLVIQMFYFIVSLLDHNRAQISM